jgi:xylan 1,4-beta-xylosidase
VQTCVSFEPTARGQLAGLVCFYDTADSYYLCVGYDGDRGRVVEALSIDAHELRSLRSVPLGSFSGPVHLRAELLGGRLQLSFSEDERAWVELVSGLDATRLSDEYREKFGFTGAFVGMCAHDLEQRAIWAHFDYFECVPGETA